MLFATSFHAYNIGRLCSRASEPLFALSGIIQLLESTGVLLSGASSAILGCSDIVSNGVSSMLRNKDATVTQCHSLTKNLERIVQIQFR
jgi:methylenetetrahydrofolate dehydrogenase (NADP+)/methenyltetrahydrofolate cyclohydrolase/formyltetrahydrofolate synthetase